MPPVSITASGTGPTTCTSPGGNQSPGQNPAVPATSGGDFTLTPDKNGNLKFNLTASEPAQPTAAAAGCPNDNWTAAFTDISYTSATISISQGSFSTTCTFALQSGTVNDETYGTSCS